LGSQKTKFIGIVCHVLLICVGKYLPEDDQVVRIGSYKGYDKDYGSAEEK